MPKGSLVNSNRISAIREKMKTDAIIVTSLPNIYYFTGFTGSSAVLLITRKRTLFFTDFRYKEQIKREVKNAETIIIKKSLFEDLAKHPALKTIKTVGFEPQTSYAVYKFLKKTLKGPAKKRGIVIPNRPSQADSRADYKKLIPLKNEIESLRMFKDETEINTIKKAARISESAFKSILPLLKPGITEKELALEFDYQVRKNGGTNVSFTTIIAGGPNAALPHAQVSDRKLKNGDTIVIDFGALYNHYCSDTTRTIILGKNPKAEKIYKIVEKAQQSAIEAIKIGVPLSKIDAIARKIITDAGYGEYFGHGLGHGVGINVHEAPGVTKTSKYKAMSGMVFTIEPGIYLPNFGGVRIEDMILVKDKGIEIITHSPYRADT